MKTGVKVRDIKRFNQVFNTIFKREWTSFWTKKGSIKNPETIREIVEELGGSFVKLAQFLSLRPDLLPQKYCDELSKLQDSVKPFPFTEAQRIIESGTGKKLKDLFSSFEKKPVASASIGQVYKAKLKTGEKVAVKLRRPGITKLMETDMEILSILADQIKNHAKMDVIDPEGIVEELKDYTKNELNFMMEASKIRKFHMLFDGTPVKIPKPFIHLCNEDMIVMEYIEGKKLNDYTTGRVPKERRKEIADNIVNAFFKQIFMDGYFHADPHPGNILVLEKSYYPNYKIAFLDFGITGEITRDVKESMVHLFIALLDRDLEHLITAMAELHFIDSESQELRRDMKDMLGPYYGASLKQVDVPRLFMQSIKVARKNNIKVPKNYVLLGKALVTLESVCSLVDPDFNLVESSKPFVTKLMIKKYMPKALAKRGLGKIEALKTAFEEIPELTKRYIKRDMEHEQRMDELSSSVKGLEKDLRHFADKIIMLGTVFVLLLASYLFMQHSAIIAYALFGVAIILLIVSFFHKKN